MFSKSVVNILKVQGIGTIFTDLLTNAHIFRNVHSEVASKYSTVYHTVSQTLWSKTPSLQSVKRILKDISLFSCWSMYKAEKLLLTILPAVSRPNIFNIILECCIRSAIINCVLLSLYILFLWFIQHPFFSLMNLIYIICIVLFVAWFLLV
jgi:hypothetical protein